MIVRIFEVDCAGRHFVSFQRIICDLETGQEIHLGCLEVDVVEPDAASTVLAHVGLAVNSYRV